MRNIKYKAWAKNPDLEKYIIQDVLRLDFFLGTNTLAKVYTKSLRQSNPFDVAFDSYDHNKVELLEFTGQYDNEGNEVYTGYIIECSEYHTLKSLRGLKAKVIWSDTFLSYGIDTPTEGFLSLSETNEYTVIGNIYENKELLNE